MIAREMPTDLFKPAATAARYLGVDIRPRSYGFVILEDATVLDNGVRTCEHPQFDHCLGQRFLRILRMYDPAVVVVRGSGHFRDDKRKAITSAIKKGAKQHGIAVVQVSPAALLRFFRGHNASTKYEIAQTVASLLPDLTWKLPRKRRPWESEDHRASIFDAAAAAITYVAQDDGQLA